MYYKRLKDILCFSINNIKIFKCLLNALDNVFCVSCIYLKIDTLNKISIQVYLVFLVLF